MQRKKYARTKQVLARALGITAWTLNSYWHKQGRPKDHADGNCRYDIEAYRKWIASFKSAHNFGSNHNNKAGNGEYPMNERERALTKLKQIEIEDAQFRLDRERGKYWPKIEGKSVIQRFATTLWTELEKALVHELPARDDGLPAGEIAKIHRDRLRDLRGSVGKILSSV